MRRARPDEIDAVADVLAGAFADSPFTRWTVQADDRERRVRGLQRLALELIGFDHGEVWVADADGGILAAVAFTDSRAPAPESVIAELHERSIAFTGTRLAQSNEANAAAAALVPDWDHVTLTVVGVRAGSRRQGLGSAVIEPGLREARRMGLPVRLETSKEGNVRFYERFGFVVTDHVDLGGLEIWAMVRTPSR